MKPGFHIQLSLNKQEEASMPSFMEKNFCVRRCHNDTMVIFLLQVKRDLIRGMQKSFTNMYTGETSFSSYALVI